MKTKNIRNNRNAGFTLVEIMIVVAIIGLLAAIAIPNFVRARTSSQANACINNLRQVDGAIQQWALEMKQGAGAQPVSSDVAQYLKKLPTCPTSTDTFANCYTLPLVSGITACKIVPTTHVLP